MANGGMENKLLFVKYTKPYLYGYHKNAWEEDNIVVHLYSERGELNGNLLKSPSTKVRAFTFDSLVVDLTLYCEDL